MAQISQIIENFQAWLPVLAYLASINVVAFAAFGADKSRAKARARRIPEATLLVLVALGGGLGALLAQSRFRHKTRKTSFKLQMWVIIAVQVAMLLTFYVL